MELINATRMQAGYSMGLEPSGRELLVVAVKGTYHLPLAGERPRLLEQQVPLVMADTFSGEPGLSAPIYETDFAPKKHRCDVLLLGSAYAPGGDPCPRVGVGMKVGNVQKRFVVTGPRVWKSTAVTVRPGEPQPFVSQPISYDIAFGGVDNHHENEAKHAAFIANPVGLGFHQHLKSQWVDAAPMPRTEQFNVPITLPHKHYVPQAFGPVGRGWHPRSTYGGTYDQHWLDEIFPFLPPDFNELYYQSAPAEQQTAYLQGGEEVILINLTPNGRVQFNLPHTHMPVYFFPRKGPLIEQHANADTLVFEPDQQRFTITWRTHLPLKRNMFEIAQVVAGKRSKAWWRARQSGKTYYSSLDQVPAPKKTRHEGSTP
ncbi:DUF2169 domain-containing protein [Ketobacter sp.]|uniref:DUF2169 family type VI secretion system accessory protein n=1 Tax=Ketobacter sp. TaxID=2083498 RepID=UPI000F17F298|nr:DUF2169 domain-containing protein [Ketobacter sp.]RLU00315.1 MAG: DUF2169 domain-containing protein [Ketobacter sp.]